MKFFAPQIITGSGVQKERTIQVENGLITSIDFGSAADAINLNGSVIPGFVDIHCHGGGGFDSSVDPRAGEFHLKTGTTTMLASFVSEPINSIVAKLEKLEFARNVIGVHLEGPYISHAHCGAHKAEYLTNPIKSDLEKFVATKKVKHITIAPEIEGALDAIKYLSQNEVLVAIGHSAANSDVVNLAIDNGAKIVTHLYNGMKKDYSDKSTLIGSALHDSNLGLELILDGVHVPLQIIKDIIAAANTRIIGITDAAPFAGQVDGEYLLGELPVQVVDQVARLKTGGALAGSTLTMDKAFATAINLLGINPVDAVQMYCTRPAFYLAAKNVGDIAIGKKANFLVMNDEWQLKQVYFEGELVS
ncbi:MAG: amidohydrolase family protein [Candidatus Nanopelagicaceae bacterium]|nr:amidohydrolase family protein [Candidatus Nanopelagicaceae bacterium]